MLKNIKAFLIGALIGAVIPLPDKALATQYRLEAAAGVGSETGVQYGSIAGQYITKKGLIQQIELCVYHDNRSLPGNVPNIGCGFYSIGLEVGTSNPIVAQALGGMGFITHSDNDLTGIFPQFHGEFNLSYQDIDTHNRIGIEYAHTSNGNLRTPNWGKDSIALVASIPLN